MERKILYELKSVNCEIINKINKTTMPLGVTQIKIVDYLIKHPVTYQKDLEKNLNLTRATISCVLKTMEKNKLIERSSNELDARSKEVVLNNKVRENLENNIEEIKKLEHKLIKNIDPNELDIFFKVLDKIKENIRSDENV